MFEYTGNTRLKYDNRLNDYFADSCSPGASESDELSVFFFSFVPPFFSSLLILVFVSMNVLERELISSTSTPLHSSMLKRTEDCLSSILI